MIFSFDLYQHHPLPVLRPCDCPQLGSLPKSPRAAAYGVPVAGPTIGAPANHGFVGMQINSGELFMPSRLVTSGQLPLVDTNSGKSLNVGMEVCCCQWRMLDVMML